MNNKKTNINWLVVGIILFVILPPIGLIILIYAAATGRIVGLAAKIIYAAAAFILLILFLIFVVFDKAVHFA
ncbi:MAG TPA: hypothetical protein VFW90_00275 [Candidatus Saccharimonadales bacterium]|nr:hypothetical protein [Candidatus Saccharimonadales bacterium]